MHAYVVIDVCPTCNDKAVSFGVRHQHNCLACIYVTTATCNTAFKISESLGLKTQCLIVICYLEVVTARVSNSKIISTLIL